MIGKYDKSKYKVAKESYNSGVVYTGMTVDGEEITEGHGSLAEAEIELEKAVLSMVENEKKDLSIRQALKDADSKHKLGIVAAITSVQGGEKRLREIINTDAPLGFFERSVLFMHLS